MGVVGNISIGMVVRSGGFTKGLKTSEIALAGFVSKAQGLGAGLKSAIAGGLAGAGVVGLFVKSAQAASALNEQVSATGVMFGKSAGIVTKDADEMAQKFGLVRSEYLESANALAPLFTSIGKTDEEAAKLSVGLLHLATDLSSIRNVPMEEALGAIRSGLVGEAEPLRKFGVLISDATMKAEALRIGLYRGKGELTEQQKVQARLSLITQGLGYANGDLARTFDGVANQSRSFGGRFTYMLEEAGKALEPVSKALLMIGNNALMAISEGFEASKQSIADWAASAVKAGGVFDVALKYVGMGIGAVADAIAMLPAVWKGTQANMTLGAAKLTEAIAYIGQSIASLINLIPGMHVTFGATTQKMADSLNALAKEQFKGYATALAETPVPSTKITAFFDGLRAKLTKETVNVDDAATPSVPRPLAPTMPGKSAGKQEKTLAAAMDAGSKDAYSAIVKANIRSPGQDAGKQLVAVNQQQLSVEQAVLTTLKAIQNRLSPSTPTVVSL